MGAVSRMFLPPAGLSSCLMAGIFRDTRGAVLGDADRLNYFPATPLVSVTQVQTGALHVREGVTGWQDTMTVAAAPRLFAMGPQAMPTTSWSPDEVVALTLGVFPDAWTQLGGDPGFCEVPDVMKVALEGFGAQPDPIEGWRALCDLLMPAWSDTRAAPQGRISDISDWTKSVLTRAALSGTGRSLRALERRIKRATGQSRRRLEFFAAFEDLHRIAVRNAQDPLAEIALDAGFADQSHMGRAVRRATGFSPARLNRAIETQEAFWCYRLLGERF